MQDNYSRTLSWILRHGIIKLNLSMDNEGYVLLDDVMNVKVIKGITIDDIKEIVSQDNKKRYNLITVQEKIYIRANQGHSSSVGNMMSDDKHLKKISSSYPICIHGTNFNAYQTIKTVGLLPMNRKHVHLATGYDAKSGIRNTSKVIIYIDMKKAMKDGLLFYMSDNDVILTPNHILPKYFKKVEFM